MQFIKIFLAGFLFLSASLNASEGGGSLSISIFKNGKPLSDTKVIIDAKNKYMTDTDGSLEIFLSAGKHKVEIFGKERDINLGYFKRSVEIKKDKDTQITAEFSEDDSDEIDIDTPFDTDIAINKSTGKAIFSGEVISSDTNKSVPNARIFVMGTDIDARTDAKGKFELEVPSGINLNISFIHSEHTSQTLKNIVLDKDATMQKTIVLTPASMELEEFVVLAPKVKGSIASIMAEEKESQSIASIIGSEQMKKQGDSSAASALKRVAGVTLMGGKYIYVRGLGDRYSATELNSMALPSPNPIKRTVPLDLFPSGVISSLEVQKTFSSNIPGTFGGGYVNVRTKDNFSEDKAKISIGASAHSSMGNSANSYQGNSNDWTGYDDNYRPLNSLYTQTTVPQVGQTEPTINYSNDEMQNFTTQRSYNLKNTTVPMGQSIALEFSKSIDLDEHKFYISGSYGYKSDAKNVTYNNYEYRISSSGEQSDDLENYSLNNRYIENISHGGLFNIGYKYRTANLKFTKLYVQNTINQTRTAEGTFGENNSDEKRNFLEWQERELDINQLSGGFDYKVFVGNRFDFGFEQATAKEYVPNDVYYNLKNYQDTYIFFKNQTAFELLNRTTDDELTNYFIKNNIDLDLFSKKDFLELGYSNEDKDRTTNLNRTKIKSTIDNSIVVGSSVDDILNYSDTTKLDYNLISNPKDSFNANFTKSAYYANIGLEPTDALFMQFGVRVVEVNQLVKQYTIENNLVDLTSSKNEYEKTLPSLSAKYTFNKKNQVKLAYTETFIYPDFREFIESEFIHPVFIAKVAGNPELVETDIQNIDFQYGHYFNDIENVTVSLFYKYMKNPIEDTMTYTSSTLDRYSFENSDSAELTGLELSWYKNFGFIYPSLKNIIFSGNYTYINSEVSLTQEQKEKFVTQSRGLQGLSPQVINLSFTYQNKQRSLNLSYNKMEERLMRVALKNGDVILGLDDYEVPPSLLDFTWVENYYSSYFKTDFSMSMKIKNILDSETIWKQKDKTTLEYKTGQSFSFSVSAKI
ncbi:MAG: carboxypeptidase-like regulatory domain-containing protein [Thiovulaceae bacterium]|nr:carboxypeptidase-like regulatory domain-containing protein [Sulfurimonadaceae bacterium]